MSPCRKDSVPALKDFKSFLLIQTWEKSTHTSSLQKHSAYSSGCVLKVKIHLIIFNQKIVNNLLSQYQLPFVLTQHSDSFFFSNVHLNFFQISIYLFYYNSSCFQNIYVWISFQMYLWPHLSLLSLFSKCILEYLKFHYLWLSEPPLWKSCREGGTLGWRPIKLMY